MLLLVATETALAQGWNGDSGHLRFSKVSPEVLARTEHSTPDQTVKVIVQYKQVPQSAQLGRMQARGAHMGAKLDLVKGAAFSVPAKALPALEADPEIVSVTLDHDLHGLDDITNVATNVPYAWNAGYNGAGIGVAVIDSGINDTHPDLWNSAETHSRVVYHQDFTGTPTTNSSGALYDLYGHGTHVAGIIGGNGYLSGGAYGGVAPAVNLVDLRALNSLGVGTDSTVIAAIQEAITLQKKYNIQVINLSLGRGIYQSYTTDPLCQAVESAWKSGIVVVVAAGNFGRLSIDGTDGYGTITAPGNDPFVITVGALNSNGSSSQSAETMTSYTSKGPTTYDHVSKPDIMAPGNDIISLAAPGATLEALFPTALVDGNNGKPEYFTLSGTSMATPVVSGAVALLLEHNGNLTPDQVKARLMQSTYASFPTSTTVTVPALDETFTEYYDSFSVGSGLLNVEAAWNDNSPVSSNVGAALSPYVTASFTNKNGSGTVSMVAGNSTISAKAVVWQSAPQWDFSAIWCDVKGSSVIWDVSLPWNDNLLNAFSVVWGSSTGTTPQSTSVVWGANLGVDYDVLVIGDSQN
ncbi:MAG TPA: S8 family peptidase [Terriglobales bacterium]|nr:S8 family peptidase [Terriglobales bacterium]